MFARGLPSCCRAAWYRCRGLNEAHAAHEALVGKDVVTAGALCRRMALLDLLTGSSSISSASSSHTRGSAGLLRRLVGKDDGAGHHQYRGLCTMYTGRRLIARMVLISRE